MVVDFHGMYIEDLKLEKVEPLPEHISLDMPLCSHLLLCLYALPSTVVMESFSKTFAR